MISERMDSLRNRYFYGKLLTAQDFQTEQNYFNQKRRTINRLLFGPGVVCGLTVIKADDQNIAVESGLALDASGREIAVWSPFTRRLDAIEGFSSVSAAPRREGISRDAYLCIEYRELPVEPAHSITRGALEDENEGPEHNKIRESFALLLSAEPPEPHPCNARSAAVYDLPVSLDNSDVQVSLTLPKYVTAGRTFALETHIRKSGNREVRVSYRAEMKFLKADGGHSFDFSFTEPAPYDRTAYCVRTPIAAGGSTQTAEIVISDLTITDGGSTQKFDTQLCCRTEVTDDSVKALLETENQLPLRRRMEMSPPIVLAKLRIFVSPQYAIIEEIVNLPYEQRVLTVPQMKALQILEGFSEHETPDTVNHDTSTDSPPPVPQTSSGTVNVVIPAGAKRGEIYKSAPHPHGLGPGTVFVTAGLDGDALSFGDGQSLLCDAAWGVRVDKTAGTFTVNVRPLGEMSAASLKFCWMATRPDQMPAAAEPKLSLHPDVKYTARHETIRFEASLAGRTSPWRKGELEWSILPESGGRINESGVFTAGDNPGFVKVMVRSMANPDVTAKAIVVIK